MFLLNFSLFLVSDDIDAGENGQISQPQAFQAGYNWIESTFGDKDKHIGAGC